MQAKWELQKKLVKRPQPLGTHREDTYDPDNLKEFVTFLKTRVKCPLPEWWVEAIVDVDVVPGKLHGFERAEKSPDLKEATAGGLVPDGADLVADGKTLCFTQGKRKLSFSIKDLQKKTPISKALAFSVAWSGKVGAVAVYCPVIGAGGMIYGFPEDGGKQLWESGIWCVHRKEALSPAPHCLEVVATEDTFFVCGQEISGMYLEAFESATGKCRFRFCTCYWSNFSETWKLK